MTGESRPVASGGHRRAVLLLIGVFVAGLAFGVGGTLVGMRWMVFHPPAGGWATRHVERMLARDLGLDAAQKEAVERIVAETRQELVAVADRATPEVREILERAKGKIRAELRPEQQAKFDREVAERMERLERLRRRWRGEVAP